MGHALIAIVSAVTGFIVGFVVAVVAVGSWTPTNYLHPFIYTQSLDDEEPLTPAPNEEE